MDFKGIGSHNQVVTKAFTLMNSRPNQGEKEKVMLMMFTIL